MAGEQPYRALDSALISIFSAYLSEELGASSAVHFANLKINRRGNCKGFRRVRRELNRCTRNYQAGRETQGKKSI